MLWEVIKRTADWYRRHPWQLLEDVGGAAAITALSIAVLYL